MPNVFTITKVKSIPLPKDPPEVKPEPKPLPRQAQTATRPRQEIKLTELRPIDLSKTFDPPKPVDFEWSVIAQDPPARPAPPKPVRMAAVLDSRSPLQPDYPPSEQRSGNEGAVVVRVLIGADGRVKKVEKVSAGSDAFFRATERQALRYWRFRPATLDGQPIESWQQMTVRFQLSA